MGEIWLARDLQLERTVALKVLRSDLTHDAARIARFRQEARAASALNHPNVCTIHAIGQAPDGQQFIAIEYIPGTTLRKRLADNPLSLDEALAIGVQVASALTAAHAAGVVHRDLKPENVMIRGDGLVKVVDFGLAKLSPIEAGPGDATLSVVNTEPGLVFGTVAYMSPEQARGQELDARSDVWSLGVMLYEMTAGRNPFAAPSTSEAIAAILDRDAPPVARFNQDAPAELERIVSKCLRKDRERRYQGMKDMLLDLQAVQSSLAARTESSAARYQGAEAPSGWPASNPVRTESVAGHGRRRIWVVLSGLALVITLIGAGWWTIWRRAKPPAEAPSIAVLPFKTIGSSDAYFADGLTEAVTTELGRVGGLRVIASNTAFRYRDNPAAREIGRELGVRLLVRGSVQRADDALRVDVSLVDTRDDTALWSNHFSREATRVLDVQGDISRQIAVALSTTLGSRTAARSASSPTRNPEAYDAYLRGLWHLKGHAPVSAIVQSRTGTRRLAVEHLQRAVTLDGNFALARAALASAYTQQLFYEAGAAGVDEKAYLEIQQALTIDPDLPEAYLARAQLTWTAGYKFPHEKAVSDLRHALSINPNLADAYVELEKIYYHIGLTDKAIGAHRQAHRLDPAQAMSSNRDFRALTDAGRRDEVRAQIDRGNLGPYARADALVALGRLEEALAVLGDSGVTKSTDPEYDVGAPALLSVVYARLGRRAEAERTLEAAIPAARNRNSLSHLHHAQLHIGATLALLGRKDQAIEWLTRAADEGYPSYPRFSTDESLISLRADPAFEALLTRLRKQWEAWMHSL